MQYKRKSMELTPELMQTFMELNALCARTGHDQGYNSQCKADLSKMTVPELKRTCRDQDMSGYCKWNKKTLVEVLSTIMTTDQIKALLNQSLKHSGGQLNSARLRTRGRQLTLDLSMTVTMPVDMKPLDVQL